MEMRDHSTPNLSVDSTTDSTAAVSADEGQNEKNSGAPDGGFKAWAVVAGGLINYCATFGTGIEAPIH